MSKPQAIVQNIDLGDGRTITLETGKYAKQANGSCLLTMGETILLATVVSNLEAREGVDFLPLTVEYKEKYASTGRFPGGFFKREARPSEYEILICRLVDRALRPLFPDDYHAETQVIITLYSLDKEVLPDSLACLAASTAIAISDIPFNGPVSESRVARVDGKFILNPGRTELENADLDMMIAGSQRDIVMVEGEMKEISENDMVEAIKFGHEGIRAQCHAQKELALKVNAEEKRTYSHETNDEELRKEVHAACYEDVYKVVLAQISNKKQRKEAFQAVLDNYKEKFSEEDLAEKAGLIGKYYHDVEKEAMRNMVLNERTRLDGRKLDEIRPIWSEVDRLPGAHGSSVFTRGETQSLTSVTLGTKMDEQIVDGVVYEGKNPFYLHYNFPPFSTGEARMMRSTSRREIGHGNLAMRALKGMLPDELPYTVRVVSEILESNGSSSMATVCAGSLAMMDAGIQLKKPVSGIAMGLIFDEESGNYAILSDILGDEDHLGDMDFKVTGTEDGITACQMDIKINGLSYQLLEDALEQAKKGRHHILGKMSETLSAPRADYKPHAPRIVQLIIPKEFIGAIIGPGGKVIQEMQAATNTKIIIDEVDDKGVVDIVATDKASIDAAVAKIKGITALPEVGEVYEATVKKIMPYGAFVEFLPGKEGLLHISEVSWERLENLDSMMKAGDKLEVKLLDIDPVSGKYRLSRKVLLERPKRDERREERYERRN